MPRQIPRVVGLIAFIAMLFVLSVDVGWPNAAPADDCLTAPRSPAPQGTHWYYRMDRTNQRKCWYVRAPGQPAQQAPALSASDPRDRGINAFDAGSVGAKGCNISSERPWQQRSALAASQNSCRQAKACGRGQRDNGQIW
jgi:hypothetical protein